jgi:hypothetical protein
VREHEKYVAHTTCGYLQSVNSNIEENPVIDKRKLNHARARTRALARMSAVREHDKYVARAVREYEKYVAYAT